IRRRPDHFRSEPRRLRKARERAGLREHLSEPAIAFLIGPLRVPVGPLIPDEEQAVHDRDEAHEPHQPPSRHGAGLYCVTTMAPARTSGRRRFVFAAVAVALAVAVPTLALLAVDVYLHRRFQTSAGYNVWGYRGPIAGRKQPGETRIVVTGGSAAYGYGVSWDQAMPVRLERALNAR